MGEKTNSQTLKKVLEINRILETEWHINDIFYEYWWDNEYCMYKEGTANVVINIKLGEVREYKTIWGKRYELVSKPELLAYPLSTINVENGKFKKIISDYLGFKPGIVDPKFSSLFSDNNHRSWVHYRYDEKEALEKIRNFKEYIAKHRQERIDFENKKQENEFERKANAAIIQKQIEDELRDLN